MDTKTALSIYQTYTLEKIGAFSKQQLIAQYAQCEEISKLKKEMSANTAATNKILRNQLKELERQEKQRYYKSLIFNMGLALKRITEQENENFRTFVMNLFIKPMLTYSKEAMDNLDEIQDKEYAMNILRQIEDASTNKLSDTFNKSVWSRYKPSVVEEELTKIKESISEKKKEIDKINSELTEFAKKLSPEIELTFFQSNIEGEIIDKRFLAARPDVARNQEIVALFKSSGVTISITAISQSEGNVGDYVMLKSPKYQRVYRGKVIAPNRVLVIM